MHLTLYRPDSWDRGERWSIPCPVTAEEGAFRCKIPAGNHDLRLRPGGFASEYFWNLAVAAEKAQSLGKIALKPGASIVGRLETVDGTPFDDTTQITLHHSVQLDGNAVDQRLKSHSSAAAITPRGFFQMTGLNPGTYRLIARQQGFAESAGPELFVVAGRESTLLEPLILARPVRLQLRLKPPRDPYGKPWKIGLSRESPRAWHEGETDDEGQWATAELPEGEYRLSIDTHRGDRWHRETLTLVPWEPLDREIELSIVPIHGIVTLGGEPLEAHLWFGGRHGFEKVHRYADAQGHFRGFLPREGAWPLEFQLPGDRQSRFEAKAVQVELDPESDIAEVRIELPATELSGRVRDSQGRPLAGATVTVHHAAGAGRAGQHTDKAGEFHFQGLPAGSIAVKAELGDRASPRSTVDLREDTPVRDVLLTLAAHREIVGRIVSEYGPVPRARLMVFPEVSPAPRNRRPAAF